MISMGPMILKPATAAIVAAAKPAAPTAIKIGFTSRVTTVEIAAANADAPASLSQEVLKEAEYFATNASRMRYPEFRKKGFFVGSGVVEAGCKSVIGSRLKRSGMFWTVRGANAIIALRCCRINGRFEDYWEQDRVA